MRMTPEEARKLAKGMAKVEWQCEVVDSPEGTILSADHEAGYLRGFEAGFQAAIAEVEKSRTAEAADCEMTLDNEVRWMEKNAALEASLAKIKSALRTSLKIQQAWMGGHITFKQWNEECEKVFDTLDKQTPTDALEAHDCKVRIDEVEICQDLIVSAEHAAAWSILQKRLTILKGAK